MCGIEKMFNGAINEYMSTSALCKFMAPDLNETEDHKMHCKAMGCVWAIAAGYERDLVTKNIKLTR